MGKGYSHNFEIEWDRRVLVLGAFKLDHLHPFKLLLFRYFSNLFTFIRGGQFLLPQRANNGKKGIFCQGLKCKECGHFLPDQVHYPADTRVQTRESNPRKIALSVQRAKFSTQLSLYNSAGYGMSSICIKWNAFKLFTLPLLKITIDRIKLVYRCWHVKKRGKLLFNQWLQRAGERHRQML